jgi:beta-N-acetylhexosaminidase
VAHGAFILAPKGGEVTDWERGFFKDADPWAFILFARNIDTPDQLRRLTNDLRDTVGRDALVLIDQEGGRVQRMRSPHWREWLPPLDQAETARDAARGFWLRYRIIADELRSVGIDANCAPTCDVAQPDTHPFLRNRCLGTDAATVIANARASAEGHLAGGVLPILKHMPGHGRGKVDSHLGLPVADVTFDEASVTDFAPFRALNDLPLGMSAHIVYPAMGDRPATQNPDMIRLIREDIGFNGLLMTDDISMEALNGTVDQRGLVSLQAGCDVVLHCNGEAAEMEAIAKSCGQMSEAAMTRAEAAMACRKTPEPVDIEAIEAELIALLA